MRIAIAAGGTAGHINPALALAEELRDRGHEVTFFGRPSKLEGTLVPQAGFSLVDVEVTGFDRSRPWTALSSLYRVWSAKRDLARRFKKEGAPDVADRIRSLRRGPAARLVQGEPRSLPRPRAELGPRSRQQDDGDRRLQGLHLGPCGPRRL